MPTPSHATSHCQTCSLGVFCASAQETNIVTQHHTLKKGEILHTPKSTFVSLYAVQSGALKTYDVSEEGRATTHGFYFQHEVYGFEAISIGHHPHYAQALTETVLCEISHPAFLQLLEKKPHLIQRLMLLISHLLSSHTYRALAQAEGKVLLFLRDIEKRLPHTSIDGQHKLPMSYNDIGEYLGLAGETVNRALTSLRKTGKIYLKNKHFHTIS